MRRESKTKDPAGTAVGIIGGGAVAAVGMVLCPPLAILGIFGFLWAKGVSKHFAAKEIDDISLDNCDRIAREWQGQVGRGSATITVSKTTDALIPLPQTRIHRYTFGDERDGEPSVLLPIRPPRPITPPAFNVNEYLRQLRSHRDDDD